MHVLYHHRTAGDRVEAVHIMGIVRALREMGHTVEISGPPGCHPERKRRKGGPRKGPKPKEGILRGKLKRLARTAPPLCFEVMETLYNVYALFDMVRRAWRRKPDMIYERTTSNSIAPTWLARRWNVPIVQEVNVTAEIGHLRPLVMRRLTLAVEQWMTRRATLLVTVSDTFKRMLVGAGFPSEKIFVCQNAVHPEDFDPNSVQVVERPKDVAPLDVVIGYVGAFVPYHRLDMLVDAARDLADDHTEARWLLVGDGVDRPKVDAAIAESGLENRFWMPGSVDHALVPSYLKAMDIAVLPSSEQFNSPMKLFEYMAMGLPVIVPDRPAIREVIEHRKNGLLFRAGDPGALTAALRELLEHDGLRRRIGRQARQDVLDKHTWVKVTESILARLGAPREIGASSE
jgi:glycosyltransferase involved in cell wall biosynthesis